ncbi:MAG: hypothetical protein KGM16_01300 [Bacteroidota bacterium]|nr:hypothetical protein [Bacteroidota bacterium]
MFSQERIRTLQKVELYIYFMSRKYKFLDSDKLYFFDLNPVMAGSVIKPEDGKYRSACYFFRYERIDSIEF